MITNGALTHDHVDNEPDMPPKLDLKGSVSIYCITQTRPSEHDIRTVDTASDWLITNFGAVNCFYKPDTRSYLKYIAIKEIVFNFSHMFLEEVCIKLELMSLVT